MALIPIRQYVMPKVFAPEHLHELDMAEYEEAPPVDPRELLKEAQRKGVILEVDEEEERRQALDKEVVGDMMPQVKHHLTREQVSLLDSTMLRLFLTRRGLRTPLAGWSCEAGTVLLFWQEAVS